MPLKTSFWLGMKFGPTMQKILLAGFSLTKSSRVCWALFTWHLKKQAEYQVTDEATFSPKMSWMKYVISKCYIFFMLHLSLNVPYFECIYLIKSLSYNLTGSKACHFWILKLGILYILISELWSKLHNNKKQYIIIDDNHMTVDSNLYINPIKYL